MTVLTCVCWSMTSAIQIAYGSLVLLHGKSRALARYHRRRGAANRLAEGGAMQRKIGNNRRGCNDEWQNPNDERRTKAYKWEMAIVKPLNSYTCKLTAEQ